MAEIINLRRAKRRLARIEAAQSAQENRVRHGRTASQLEADRREAARKAAQVEGARLDPPPEPES